MVSYEGKKFGVTHRCTSHTVKIKREGPTILIADEKGELVGEYTPVPEQKMYYHSQQWPSDYKGAHRPLNSNYGIAIQQAEGETLFLAEPTSLNEYDDVVGGTF